MSVRQNCDANRLKECFVSIIISVVDVCTAREPIAHRCDIALLSCLNFFIWYDLFMADSDFRLVVAQCRNSATL